MSEKFDADAMAQAFLAIKKATTNATIKPRDLDIAGAFAFKDGQEIRLVIQYEIKLDKYMARFSALIETPDAD